MKDMMYTPLKTGISFGIVLFPIPRIFKKISVFDIGMGFLSQY